MNAPNIALRSPPPSASPSTPTSPHPTSGFNATVAYVASKRSKLAIRTEANSAPFRAGTTTANSNVRRIYAPNFQSILNYKSNVNSSYHSIPTTLNKRFSNGYTILASNTYGRSIDLTLRV